MKSIIKFIISTVVTLLIVLILGTFLIGYFVNINQFKSELTKVVKQKTGRTLLIKSNMKLSYFPLSLRVQNVTLSRENKPNQIQFSIKKATIKANLVKLMEGKFVINKLSLTGTTLYLNNKNKIFIKQLNSRCIFRDNTLTLNPIQASLYNGALSGKLTLNLDNNKLKLNTNATKISIKPLLMDAANYKQLTGNINFNFNIETSSKNPSTITNQMNGSGAFSALNGKYYGVNPILLVKQTYAALKKKPMPATPNKPATAFKSVTATFNIKNGVLSTNGFKVLGKGFSISAQGNANLNNSTIDFEQKITIDRKHQEALEVPVNITGTLTKPQFKPNMVYLAKITLQTAGDAIIKNFHSSKEGLSDAGKKLSEAIGKIFK
ncbi:MAG: AsmA family protein [Gammaproteobacteria bacterium]|nr:AsmA family protein [Gammaproteobacteria bacterium]